MGFKELARVAATTAYPVDALLFIQRGLDFTVRRTHGEPLESTDPDEAVNLEDLNETSRHVTGEQLCWGLRDYAIDQYGLLARTILKRWHIRESADFGRIVFAMVDNGLMLKTDDDTLADFTDIFEFDEAFSPEAIRLGAAG